MSNLCKKKNYRKKNNFQENGSYLWIQKKLSHGKSMKKSGLKSNQPVFFSSFF